MVYPGPLVAGRRYGPSSEWSLGFGLAGINRGIGIFQGAKKKSAPWKQTGFPRIFQSMESMAGIHKSVHGIYDIYGWMAGWYGLPLVTPNEILALPATGVLEVLRG